MQSRSLNSIDDVFEQANEYFLRSPDESDLLKLRKIFKADRDKHQRNDDADGEEKVRDSRLFRLGQSNRPASSYGRKSHWDTYFGKK